MTIEHRAPNGALRSFAIARNSFPGPQCIAKRTLPRILIVDDNMELRQQLADYLQEEGFETASVDGRAAMRAELDSGPAALILLDLRLGLDSGLDVLRDLRSRSQIPIIIITGHGREEVDRVVGLELGADDYVTKPFSTRELLARIRSVLRRSDTKTQAASSKTGSDRSEFEGWALDRTRRRLTSPSGEHVALTRGEYSLLCAFLDAPGRPLSREFLLQVTRIHEDIFDRSIDVQILRLRRKLEIDPARPQLIKTERGFGYTFAAKITRPELRGLVRVPV